MLNDYEKQKQKDFDDIFIQENLVINDKIINIFKDNIDKQNNIITNLFNRYATYDFTIGNQNINIFRNNDIYTINISEENIPISNILNIHIDEKITYEHYNFEKAVYTNDEALNLKTNKEKLKYFKNKIQFYNWIKKYINVLIDMTQDAISCYEDKYSVIYDIEDLMYLSQNYD